IYIRIFLKGPLMWERLADLSARVPASPIRSIDLAFTAPIIPIPKILKPFAIGLALIRRTLEPSDPYRPNAIRKRRKSFTQHATNLEARFALYVRTTHYRNHNHQHWSPSLSTFSALSSFSSFFSYKLISLIFFVIKNLSLISRFLFFFLFLGLLSRFLLFVCFFLIHPLFYPFYMNLVPSGFLFSTTNHMLQLFQICRTREYCSCSILCSFHLTIIK
ncbi:hypothetical protein ALC62_08475, partial [Cyphomyrmex costatus]